MCVFFQEIVFRYLQQTNVQSSSRKYQSLMHMPGRAVTMLGLRTALDFRKDHISS